MSREHDIVSYLIHNQQHIKSLCVPHKEHKESLLKSEDVLFHDIINKQYKETLNLIVGIELQKKLGVSQEDIRVVLDALNWEEYLTV